MNMDAAKLLASIFGDPPKDSALGNRMREFFLKVQADAKANGAVGAALREAIKAGSNPADSAYRTLSPMDAAQAVGLCNALKGAL